MKYLILFLVFVGFSCTAKVEQPAVEQIEKKSGVELVVLGTVQDGGAPHIGCTKECCRKLWEKPQERLQVVSLGLIDHDKNKTYIIEATPDFPKQLAKLNALAGKAVSEMPDGIFVTHAHIGHYTGLMFLGREAKGANEVPVYAMPKMYEFLSTNGPWDQLVGLENIHLMPFDEEGIAALAPNLKVIPFTVPHRDEYSETVGFIIEGPKKKVLFIPDIDKWTKWEEDIIDQIEKVDLAYLDATFYDAKEINNRDIAEIPHPFVIESMALFQNLPKSEKQKIHFIHLNHTNPLLNKESEAYDFVHRQKFDVAEYLDRVSI